MLATTSADDAPAVPPWALTDASSRTLLTLSVKTADGAAHPIIPSNSELPARGEALLTSSANGVDALSLILLAGTRPSAAACVPLGCLRLPIQPLDRGLAQALLVIKASDGRLLATARDVQTGRSVRLVLDATSGIAAEDTSSLPSPWRFETPYTMQPHPGFYCTACGVYLRTPPSAAAAATAPATEPSATIIPPRTDAWDGEVPPESTASRVWPGAYVLSSHLNQPHIASRIKGAKVIELGAGLGLPGLAAWALGASKVVLTDLDENLPRLRQAVEANGASEAAVEVAALDWCDTSTLPTQLKGASWVLAADCVFWPALFTPLLETLTMLTDAAATSPEVLLTVTSRLGRAEAFAAAADACGWGMEEVPLDGAASFLHTRLLRLSRRACVRELELRG